MLQLRLMDQLLGEQHTPGLGNGDGRGADVLPKQPAQLPTADLQSRRERVDIGLIERTAFDQLQSPRHVAEVPRQASRVGRALGAAA